MIIKINKKLNEIVTYAEPNISLIGLMSVIGFPLYYFIWNNLFPQQYENLYLRLIAMFLLTFWLFYDSSKNQKYF